MTKAVDRATAFYNEVAGQGTYKIICKSSNHDLAGPKKKHVDGERLLLCGVESSVIKGIFRS